MNNPPALVKSSRPSLSACGSNGGKVCLPLLLIAFFLFSLTACRPLVRLEQPAQSGSIPLQAGSSLGQTFTARYRGLQGIALFLQPEQAPAGGTLNLRLLRSPQDASPLASAGLPLSQVTVPGYYRFDFPPQTASSQQDYSLALDLQGPGRVQVGSAPANTYLEGALYQDGAPQEGQLAFRLIYDPVQAALGLLTEGLVWLGWLAAALFLFVLPGWALAAVLWPAWGDLSWPEKLGLGAGLSLALYPLLVLWTGMLGLRLGPAYALLPPLAGLLALAWRGRRSFPALRAPLLGLTSTGFQGKSIRLKVEGSQPSTFNLKLSTSFQLSTLFLLVLGVRLWAARSLAGPLWGDSVQHTMITQLLLDHGGLFDSWAPYAGLSSFTYHFGFHTLAAAFAWVTRLPAAQAVLWAGQILNALAVIGLYPLAARLGRSPWAGFAAVLVAGLLGPMPMTYTEWGRYTQLAGMAILPAAVLLSWLALEGKPAGRQGAGLFALAAIALGGLALSHFRVMIFAVLLVGAWVLLSLRQGRPLERIVRLLLLGLAAGILFAPWALQSLGGKLPALVKAQLTTPAAQTAAALVENNAIGNPFDFLPPLIWLLLALSLAWAIWRREKPAAALALGWALVFLAANPAWLSLPGTGALRNFDVLVAMYFPAALLIGAAVGWLLVESLRLKVVGSQPSTLNLNPSTLFRAFAFLAVLALALFGFRQRLHDVSARDGALLTRPDLRAAAWVQANTPPGSRFLVNAFFAFGGTVAVGSDAGWWLPLTAGRPTTLPPINYATEQGDRPDYWAWTNALIAAMQARGPADPEVLALLKERGVTYVYIGQRQGGLNSPGPLLDPAVLLASPYYTPVYHQDRVWVFEIRFPS